MFNKIKAKAAQAIETAKTTDYRALATATAATITDKAFNVADWVVTDIKMNKGAYLTLLVFVVAMAALGVCLVDAATMQTLWFATVAFYTITGTIVLGTAKAIGHGLRDH
jgi:hypothetical protein